MSVRLNTGERASAPDPGARSSGCQRRGKGLVVAELSRLTASAADLGGELQYRGCVRATRRTSDARATRAASSRCSSRSRDGSAGVWLNAPRKEPVPPFARGSGIADDPHLRDRILDMRADGLTLQAITARLNAEGVPTVRGGAKWAALEYSDCGRLPASTCRRGRRFDVRTLKGRRCSAEAVTTPTDLYSARAAGGGTYRRRGSWRGGPAAAGQAAASYRSRLHARRRLTVRLGS